MAGPMDSPDGAALWQRWRALASAPGGNAPDMLTLAAYAEGRLGPADVEAVEEWLSANPDLLADLAFARRAATEPLPDAPTGVVDRATSLIPTSDGSVVVLHGSARQPRWRGMVRWSAMAASIVVASAVGFALGSDTYVSLAGSQPPAFGQELLDPPRGLFTGFEEDANI